MWVVVFTEWNSDFYPKLRLLLYTVLYMKAAYAPTSTLCLTHSDPEAGSVS